MASKSPALNLGLSVSASRRGGGGGGGGPAFPITPLIWLHADDVPVSRRYWPDHQGNVAPENAMQMSSGQFLMSNPQTFTDRNATGPGGQTTAGRVVINNNGTAEFFNRSLPAGTWTYSIQAKTIAGQGTLNVNHGNVSGTFQTTSINESTWTALTGTIVSNGSSNIRFGINNTTGAAITILIDEVQLYAPGESIPAFSSEVNTKYGAPLLKTTNALTKTGGAVTAGASGNIITFETFPLTKSFSQGTMMAVVKTTNTADTTRKIMGFGIGEGTWNIGMRLGRVYGRPGMDRNALFSITDIANKGYHILASRQKAGEQAFFIDGVKIMGDADTLSTFSSAIMGLLGETFIDTQNSFFAGTAPFVGEITQALFWDTWLDDDQIISATAAARAAHLETGEADVSVPNFLIAEGDSITQLAPTYVFNHFDTAPANMIGTNMAITGSNLGNLNTRLPDLLKRIEAGLDFGFNVIVSVLIGANGLPTIGQLETYWGAITAAGAKLIACTITPKSDGTFNTNRNALNTQIRASSVPHRICDFAADPVIGTDAAGSDPTKYGDGTHPTASTQTIMYTDHYAPALASQDV